MTDFDADVPWADVVGIGLGPANLSLAALLEPLRHVRGLFCEAGRRFSWHPGMMLPESQVQVPYLKDLVTLVDPTNRFSFLNFLAESGRLHRFLIANLDRVSRIEYDQYYAWVCSKLDFCRFDTRITAVELSDRAFDVWSDNSLIARAPNLVIGTGRQPQVPSFAQPLLGAKVLHSSDFLHKRPSFAGKRVLVVGGGQSGAEVFAHVIGKDDELPAQTTWIASRETFWPLDESPFVNEWFTPNYVEHFRSLSSNRRRALLGVQHMASDGISAPLLQAIYRRLYELDYLRGAPRRCTLLPAHRVVAAEQRRDDRVLAKVLDVDAGQSHELVVDVAVFATGYKHVIPTCLEPVLHLLDTVDGDLVVGPDYTIAWKGPEECRIFGQSMARNSHGIADPNLSLNAWRSAVIINAICGKEVYQIDRADTAVSWDRLDNPDDEVLAVGTDGRDSA